MTTINQISLHFTELKCDEYEYRTKLNVQNMYGKYHTGNTST